MCKKIFPIVVAIGVFLATSSCGLPASHDFSQSIADCKAMDDVTFIVEGRFTSSEKRLKQTSKFDNMRTSRKGQKRLPKPIYSFQADIVHLGSTGVMNNKTGKQVVKSLSYPIREGEAPEGLKGKGLICYKGSNPRTIKSIHFAP